MSENGGEINEHPAPVPIEPVEEGDLPPAPVEPSSERPKRESLDELIAPLPSDVREDVVADAADRLGVDPEVVEELVQPKDEGEHEDEYVDERSSDLEDPVAQMEEERRRIHDVVNRFDTTTPGTLEHDDAVVAAETTLAEYNATGRENLRRLATTGVKSLFYAVAISLLLSLLLLRLHTSAGNKGGR